MLDFLHKLFGGNDKPATKIAAKPLKTAKPEQARARTALVSETVPASATNVAERKTVSIISTVDEVPIHRAIATANNGMFQLSSYLQSKLAAIEVSAGVYHILATRDFWQGNQHLSLKQDIVKRRFDVVKEWKIEDGALRILYSKDENKEIEQVISIENPELTAKVEKMVGEAVRRRATDIHVMPRFNNSERTGAVIFRVDGLLRTWDKFPAEDLVTIVGYMYSKMAEENSRSEPSFNKDAMQSCSVMVTVDQKTVRIRYQSVRVNGGLDVVLRLLVLKDDEVPLSLSKLGYAPSQERDLDIAARKTVGAIVIAGVTGSGKSTTLKTLMTMSPRMNLVKSYSIEDPVEYRMRMVSQVNVQRSSADSSDRNPYAQIMRVIMRADPDVIMAGEARDIQSCQMLQTMVQSGHQVMTTVHASSAIEILDRFASEQMGLSRHTMSSKNFISALVYQRLVPMLCSHCKLPAIDVISEDRLELLETKFGIHAKGLFAANELDNTCPHCNGTGVLGQTVAAEIIPPTKDFLRLIREGKDSEAEEFWRTTRKTAFDDPDMTGKTAFEHGLYKVSQGFVDPRHLEDNFDPFESYQIMEMAK